MEWAKNHKPLVVRNNLNTRTMIPSRKNCALKVFQTRNKKKATSLGFVVIAYAIFTEEGDIQNVAPEIIIQNWHLRESWERILATILMHKISWVKFKSIDECLRDGLQVQSSLSQSASVFIRLQSFKRNGGVLRAWIISGRWTQTTSQSLKPIL